MKWLSNKSLDRLRVEAAFPDLEGTGYRMVSHIASGGMGEVYLVEDTALDRRVALKVLNGIDSSEELTRRMLREARIVARLEHPGIVPVHDVGELADGRVFFTMKYVQGERLDHFAHGRKDALPELLRAFHKVCQAVAFAHAHGVIHRDLKPENIMVGPFGEVLVMDWGIAKVLRDRMETEERGGNGDGAAIHDHATALDALSINHRDTGAGVVLGTPRYMSPEQARGLTDDLDERTDIYALGAILFFLLTGEPPDASSHPRQINPRIPRPLDAICARAVAERREDRYAGAEPLAGDIIRFLDGQPVSAYRESIIERIGRFVRKNLFVVVLIVAYLLMRLIIFLSLEN